MGLALETDERSFPPTADEAPLPDDDDDWGDDPEEEYLAQVAETQLADPEVESNQSSATLSSTHTKRGYEEVDGGDNDIYNVDEGPGDSPGA